MSTLGINLEADIKLRDVQNALRRIQLAGKDLRPVFRASRKAFRADQREHAKARQGQAGPWPRLAYSTILHRKQRTRAQGRKRKWPLKANPKPLGRLPGAFVLTFDQRALTARSRVPWSRVHWKGGRAGRRSNIPQRDFMWISDALLRTVALKAINYMISGWKKP